MDAEFLSSPLRTEVSRCVAGEESWSEPANTTDDNIAAFWLHEGYFHSNIGLFFTNNTHFRF